MKPMIPDFCPACDALDSPFELVMRECEQFFCGETLLVTSPAMRCRACGFQILAAGQLEELRRATIEAYNQRKENN